MQLAKRQARAKRRAKTLRLIRNRNVPTRIEFLTYREQKVLNWLHKKWA